MENIYNNIDELFRKRFEDFEPDPPEHIWQKIFSKLHPGTGGGAGIGKTILLTGVAVIAVSTFILLLLNPFSNDPETRASNNIPLPSPDQDINNNLITELITPEEGIETDIHEVQIPDKIQQTTIESIEKITEPIIRPDNTNKPDYIGISNTEESPEIRNPELLITLSSIKTGDLQTNANEYKPERKIFSGTFNKYTGDEFYNPQPDYKSFFKVGAFINPEVVFNQSEVIPNGRNINVSLDVSYHMSKFFIQSGLGISLAMDEGPYNIEYNELLGTYQDVYDVTFDSTEQGIIPTYHTKTVEVFDTLNHLSLYKTKNSYAYLQIPVLFGYEFRGRHLSFNVKAGPCLSIMMYEHIPELVLPEDMRILNIEGETRIKTNWQIVTSFGMSYQLNKRLEIALEPTLRYYLNSPYEGKIITNKHPFTFGLRIGLLFKL